MSCTRGGDAIIEVMRRTDYADPHDKYTAYEWFAGLMHLLRDNPIPRIRWVNRVARLTDTSISGAAGACRRIREFLA